MRVQLLSRAFVFYICLNVKRYCMKVGVRALRWFKPYCKVCRIESWLSWVFGFGLGNVLFSSSIVDSTVPVLLAFSFATASVFVLNQYFDLQEDKNGFKSDLPLASGELSSRDALIFSFLLIVSCFALLSMANLSLYLSFFLYLALWTLYSAPYPKLKAIPIIDFLTSGVGAGFFPFFIGYNSTQHSNILLVILLTIPLTLFHCGAHIIQTIGDYEADRDAGINTFVVRYGNKNGVKIAGLMFLSAFLSTFIFLFASLVSPVHLIFFVLMFSLSIPPLLRFKQLYENPCASGVMSLQKSVKKYGVPTLVIASLYVFARAHG